MIKTPYYAPLLPQQSLSKPSPASSNQPSKGTPEPTKEDDLIPFEKILMVSLKGLVKRTLRSCHDWFTDAETPLM